MNVLLKQVESGLCSPEVGVTDGECLVLAVSGGADSMVLARAMHLLASRRHWRLVFAHFNHRLRGAESDQDETLVQSVAAEWGWPCVVERAGPGELGAEKGVSIEMAARNARHSFLARAAKANGAVKVVLAHHADDQLELFFIRLLRGAGSGGLAGMRISAPSPVDPRITLVRPMLCLRRALIERGVKDIGVPFREDESNRDPEILRNRIRSVLLPHLREGYGHGIDESVQRTMTVLAAEHEFVTTAAHGELNRTVAKPWNDIPVAVQREMIRLELIEFGVVGDFRLIEALRLAQPDQNVTATDAQNFHRDALGRVQLTVRPSSSFSVEEMWVPLSEIRAPIEIRFGQLNLKFELLEDRGGDREWERSKPGMEVFDADRIGASLCLRYWQPGDQIRPIGMTHQVKLQDWFTNEKVPAAERRRRVLMENADRELFWVQGMRIGELGKVTSETKRLLFLAWHAGS